MKLSLEKLSKEQKEAEQKVQRPNKREESIQPWIQEESWRRESQSLKGSSQNGLSSQVGIKPETSLVLPSIYAKKSQLFRKTCFCGIFRHFLLKNCCCFLKSQSFIFTFQGLSPHRSTQRNILSININIKQGVADKCEAFQLQSDFALLILIRI